MSMAGNEAWVLFGSHQGGPDTIKVGSFDLGTGVLSPPRDAIALANPGYYIFSPDQRFLYVCNQVDGYADGKSGGVTSLAFSRTDGSLSEISKVPSGGIDPSHLALDAAGKHVFIANYSTGTFAIRALNPDGSLGAETAHRQLEGKSVNPDRQTRSYAHSSAIDPTGRYAIVCDLGSDKVWVFGYDAATGTLSDDQPAFGMTAPGDGPRHLVFHPNGRWLYVNGEMGNSVCRFDWDSTAGTLTFRSRAVTIPAEFTGETTTAELLIDPAGTQLYVTNRGHNSIARLRLDPATGDATPLDWIPSQGSKPRNFEFSPDRRWAIATNHGSNNLTIFAVGADGKLSQHGEPMSLEQPYCPRFVLKA